MSFKLPEQFRWKAHSTRPSAVGDRNGVFRTPWMPNRNGLLCIASCGNDWLDAGMQLPAWEHVSVSTVDRCPTWAEMCYVKSLFWEDEDAVFQIHPPKSEYVNEHPYCLHLWRPVDVVMPRPPYITVGTR